MHLNSATAGHSIGISYSYGYIEDGANISGVGVNFKYDMLSYKLMYSSTFLQSIKNKNDIYFKRKYLSLLGGIEYNMNHATDLYMLLGLAGGSNIVNNQSHELYGPAAGFGVSFNIFETIEFNLGYEYSYISNKDISSFNVGLGYLF
nr:MULTISPECIES: outer membrane beta-barrel protein [Enterobacter]